MTDTTQVQPGAVQPGPDQQGQALPAADDRAGWLAMLARIGDEDGDFLDLGPRHWALFVDAAPTLIVSFETVEEARAREGQMPLAHQIAAAQGWSHLTIIADGETWWRDPAIWRYFDRLVDDAFFEDFDRVVFTGSGIGGYAACAYAVAAPGATVLAFAPRASMDPGVAGWDGRNRAARRLDFTSRYGFAPDMVDGAAEVFVVVDPNQPLDAMHAALFHAPWVAQLQMRYAGADPAAVLAQMQALTPLIEAAAEGRLTPALFASHWRNRRKFGPYLRTLLSRTDQINRIGLTELLCRNVTRRLKAPKFARRLAQIEADRAEAAATHTLTEEVAGA